MQYGYAMLPRVVEVEWSKVKKQRVCPIESHMAPGLLHARPESRAEYLEHYKPLLPFMYLDPRSTLACKVQGMAYFNPDIDTLYAGPMRLQWGDFTARFNMRTLLRLVQAHSVQQLALYEGHFLGDYYVHWWGRLFAQ